MTAIAGCWMFGGGMDAGAACGRMLEAQRIYSNAGSAVWSEGTTCLGRSLYSLLPEDRHDRGPVPGGGGRWSLVADLRLDNRDELCSDLGLTAGNAAALPDAAVLMKALEAWDVEALQRIVGDFAFALWDGAEERLILARDFTGQRPIHYHAGRDFFAFASMPKGLLALPRVPRAPDEQAVVEFLGHLPETGDRSFFAAVKRLPPGNFCVVSRAGVRIEKYWNPRRTQLRLKDDAEYEEALREHFDRAVECRLRGSGGRVASHLSGGLDSTSVASTAARLVGASGQVVAYTSVPREGYDEEPRRGRFYDEGAHAARVARAHPNMEHVLIRPGDRSPLDSLDRNFFLYDRPVLNICNGLWLEGINADAKRRGLHVLLTGSLGNITSSYYGLHLLPQLLSQGRWLRLAREIGQLSRNGIHLESSLAMAFGPFVPSWLWSAVHRWRKRGGRRLTDYTALHPEKAAALSELAAARGIDLSSRPESDGFKARLRLLGGFDHGNYNKGCLAGWGVDMRDPTADRRLVEFCLSLPLDQFVRNGVWRSIARRAFADRLPAEVVGETRAGYQAPDWHEALSRSPEAFREQVARLVDLPAATRTLDVAAMQDMLKALPPGDWNRLDVFVRYRAALLRGISAGHFLRSATGSNR